MNQEQLREKYMPLMGHFREMQSRLRKGVLAVLFTFVGALSFRKELFHWFALPLSRAWPEKSKMVFTRMEEGFMVMIKTSFVTAIFLAAPVIAYQVWKFVAPALEKKQKKIGIWFIIFSFLLFMGGGLFGYYLVLPPSYNFLLNATMGRGILADFGNLQKYLDLQPMLTMEEYFSFTLSSLLIFGTVFELPLVLSLLCSIGILTTQGLWKFNRYALLLFAFISAIITPGDLVVSQLAMTGALMVLYNVSIVIVWLIHRKKNETNK